MTKRSKPPKREPADCYEPEPLPPTLVATKRVAVGLKEAFTRNPFPELVKELTTWEEAQTLFDRVHAWAIALEKFYGNPWKSKKKNEFGGLLERLGVGLPEFVGLEATSSGVIRTDEGDGKDRGPQELWKLSRHPRPPRAVHSENLLGPVPVQFCSPPTIVLNDCFPADIRYEMERKEVNDREPFTASTARRFLQGLQQAEVLIRVQVLSLCAWVVEAIRKIEEAALPRISWDGDCGNGRVCVAVYLGGFTREVDLARRHFKLLKDLAADNRVQVDRRRKAELVKEIPELKRWVLPARERHGQSAHGQGVFFLPEAIKKRIGSTT